MAGGLKRSAAQGQCAAQCEGSHTPEVYIYFATVIDGAQLAGSEVRPSLQSSFEGLDADDNFLSAPCDARNVGLISHFRLYHIKIRALCR